MAGRSSEAPTGSDGPDSALRAAVADGELAAYLHAVRAEPGPSVREIGAVELRAGARRRAVLRPPGPAVGVVRDLVVEPGGVPVRLYRPRPQSVALVVYFHGGMWTIGDLESHDRFCRRLAVGADAAVLAVDYRRAPEHPYPAAVDDCVAVVRWALGGTTDPGGAVELGGPVRPVVVAGDSAGGHLATLVCLRLRDEGGPLPAGQALAYPNTDLTLSCPSVAAKGSGWGLDADAVAWGAENWVPDPALRADPAVSPLFVPDLTGLPPAVVATAEHDPLRDEGEAYAERLGKAGVPVQARREPGMVHGYLTLDTVSPVAGACGDRFIADVAALCLSVGEDPEASESTA
ncbi:alpha/beta hydrolase [Yinghuangia seranimata]|uniref:alpha/beta hydrolase n=1 Tax=Yinghuangia seranimata TaxID=408067 RepID=UPI00248CC828|nr:alpha/beta hydrolase [Yinghuangia seranimata]MDI2125245.1 alpha/beta hydrolase [Yinghuangia seranimata]